MPKNKRFGSSNILDVNMGYLLNEGGFTLEDIITDDKCKNQSRELAFVFKRNNDVIVFFYPTKDTNKKNVAQEVTPFETALQCYDIVELKKAYPDCNIKLQIPIAETFFRNHWVALSITLNKNNKVAAELYDPKGFLSWFYPTAYIKRALTDKFKDSLESYKEIYSGHQGFFNNVDCGRYISIHLRQAYTKSKLNIGSALRNINGLLKDISEKMSSIRESFFKKEVKEPDQDLLKQQPKIHPAPLIPADKKNCVAISDDGDFEVIPEGEKSLSIRKELNNLKL